MAVCLCSLTCSSVLCRLRTHAHALYALLYYVICCAGVCCTLLCYACCTVEPRSCHAPLIPSSLFIRPCPPTSIPPSQYPRPFSLLSRPYPPDSISYSLTPIPYSPASFMYSLSPLIYALFPRPYSPVLICVVAFLLGCRRTLTSPGLSPWTTRTVRR